MSAREIAVNRQRLFQNLFCALLVTFLHQYAADVHVTIGLSRVRICRSLEGPERTFEIALEEQANAEVVPALPISGIQCALWLASLSSLQSNRQRHLVRCDGNDRQIGNVFQLAGYF